MKASELFCPTLREIPSEAEVISHQLLLKAGFIRKTAGGIYTYLPLALRVLHKIEKIVREEMDRAGGQEILMPIVQPRDIWEQTGRWNVYGDEMFRLTDRHQRYYALGPTHEELVTTLVNADIHSYRDLPIMLYQIQNKYRDEIRPRFGLMRAREFIMKDGYSFHLDNEDFDKTYHKVYEAYNRIFRRMNLNYRVVEADSGAIGGNASHEYMVLAQNGEDEIVFCEQCDYAANVEKAECVAEVHCENHQPLFEKEKVYSPGQKTVDQIATFLDIPQKKVLKTLLYAADGVIVAVVLRGDRDINEVKLKNLLGCNNLYMVDEETALQVGGAGFGSLGPVGLNLKIYADSEVKNMINFCCGANDSDYHFINVNAGRDFIPDAYVDIRNAVKGDRCAKCGHEFNTARGIEVGHIFKLGTKYSHSLGASVLDQNGQEILMVMGCYGIGVSRAMAAAVEQNNDDNGISWPLPIAPYQVIIVPVNVKKEEQMTVAGEIYTQLLLRGIEVIIDDRDERAGVKFKDADLIGIPVRITIGPKALQDNRVEVKKRWNNEVELVDLNSIVDVIQEMVINKKTGEKCK